jgi:hypothetical protein
MALLQHRHLAAGPACRARGPAPFFISGATPPPLTARATARAPLAVARDTLEAEPAEILLASRRNLLTLLASLAAFPLVGSEAAAEAGGPITKVGSHPLALHAGK